MAKDNGFSETPAKDEGAKSRRPSRRAFLKAGGALLGGAAGAGAITGFPTIWAQEIKDIELRHVGVSYSVVKAIGDQASKDLGFKVTMQNLDTSAAINRFITQPDTVDIADRRGLAVEARYQAWHPPGHRSQEDQGIRQHPADLHQGRTRRPEEFRARAFRLTKRCISKSRMRPNCTKA